MAHSKKQAHRGLLFCHVARLVTGKQDVNTTEVSPVGQDAIKIIFYDGQSSGYDWDMLCQFGKQHESNWKEYLDRCRALTVELSVS
jgi:DUF971 family protein